MFIIITSSLQLSVEVLMAVIRRRSFPQYLQQGNCQCTAAAFQYRLHCFTLKTTARNGRKPL
jgi:hypothetical protein